MISPFPGMDPYLEDPAIWPDFHLTLIVALRAELNSCLPAGYQAAADRHVWIEDPTEKKRKWRDPDVFVSTAKKVKTPKPAASVAVVESRTITIPMQDRKGKPFLKILDSQEKRVVTVIELLSPTNKSPGVHRNAYLEKREEYFASGVNLVEVNLLRKGRCPPPLDVVVSEDYYILVCRSRELPRAEIWSFNVRQPFPDTPLPLRTGEQIAFNLRPCVDRAYQEARYDREIDYAKPPYPPLREKEAAWVRRLLRSQS